MIQVKYFKLLTFTALVTSSLCGDGDQICVESGWNLISSSQAINPQNYFNNTTKVNTVWVFDNFTKKWLGYSPHIDTMNLMKNNLIMEVTSLYSGQPFWIHNKSLKSECFQPNYSSINNDNDNSNTTSSQTFALPTNFTLNDGRVLGSQCAGCHGTNGISKSSFDSIKGEDNLYHEMFDDKPIMYWQAKGYTQAEANAIETWLKSF
jgi:hypothetical protein